MYKSRSRTLLFWRWLTVSVYSRRAARPICKLLLIGTPPTLFFPNKPYSFCGRIAPWLLTSETPLHTVFPFSVPPGQLLQMTARTKIARRMALDGIVQRRVFEEMGLDCARLMSAEKPRRAYSTWIHDLIGQPAHSEEHFCGGRWTHSETTPYSAKLLVCRCILLCTKFTVRLILREKLL